MVSIYELFGNQSSAGNNFHTEYQKVSTFKFCIIVSKTLYILQCNRNF